MTALRIGRIDESFYQVVGGVVAEVLRRHGNDVTVFDGTHTEVYNALGAGEIDLAVAFWLPYGHAAAWHRLSDTVEELATLYDGAKFFWAMPAYVDERIRSIADLSSSELARGVPRAIKGLSLDATITTASQMAIIDYDLTAVGFSLEPGDFETWEASLDLAVAAKQPVVLPLWEPYYLNAKYDLRILADPKGVLGPVNRVVLGARRDVGGRVGDETVAALRSTGLSLAIVSELDRRVHIERRTPDEVATAWVATKLSERVP